jgi:DNA-binding NtrC family response regulator
MGTFTSKTESILVVDSNHAAGDELSALICGMSPNYVVQRAGSGCEAIRMSENGLANIILAAEELSDMSALTFFDIVKCVKKQTTCILLSEGDGPVEKTRAEVKASFRIIKKPYDPSALAYTLDCAFDYDGLSSKIMFNNRLSRLFMALVPVAMVLGVVVGLVSKS